MLEEALRELRSERQSRTPRLWSELGGSGLGELIEADLGARHLVRVAGERGEMVEQTLEGTERAPVWLGSPGRLGRRSR
jgi:hypothetical protein